MVSLDEQLEAKRAELRELNRLKREQKLNEIPPEKKKRGRKKVSDDLIDEARILAKSKSIPFVAFKLGVSMTSLYKYDIKRKIINAEKLNEQNEEIKK